MIDQTNIQQYVDPISKAPTPFQIVGDVLQSGRDMIRKFTNPIATTPELEQQRQQSLIPKEAQRIKRNLALKQGVIPIGEDQYIDITGFVGSLENVGKNVAKTVGREVEQKAAQFLKGHFNLSGDVADTAGKELKNLTLKDYEQLAKHFKQFSEPSKKPITLYRGIQKGETAGQLVDRPTAWTRLKEVAQMHTYDDGKVIKTKVNPDQIFLDVNGMPTDKFPKGISPISDEEEVILKPLSKGLAYGDEIMKNSLREVTPNPNDYAYHATKSLNLESIANQGLIPNQSFHGKAVSFAQTPKGTKGWGGDEEMIIRIQKKNLPSDYREWSPIGKNKDPGEGLTRQKVAPENLEYSLDNGKTWDKLKNAFALAPAGIAADHFTKPLNQNATTTYQGVEVRNVPQDWKSHIKQAYEDHPALKKYQGLLEAILMQESSMGTISSSYNPKIGESAWIGGLTESLKQELDRNKIKYNLHTQKGIIDAMASYLDLKRELKTPNGKIEYKDPVNLYLQRYKTQAGIKLKPEQVARFRKYIDFYKNQ